MDINIRIIVDNIVFRPRLKAEHGLSLLITTPQDIILFDTGQSSLLLENSLKCGTDLKKVSKIVLSHGHYDHTGGLLSILSYIEKEIEVFANPGIFEEKYSRREDHEIHYIGIPDKRSIYEEMGARFIFLDSAAEIEKNVYFSGTIPRISSFEEVEDSFVKKEKEKYIKDNIYDDGSVIITGKKRNILITGCSHSGLINTLEYAGSFTGKNKLDFIIGGFHLSGRNDEYIDKTIGHLKNVDFRFMAPAHCTGLDAANRLKNVFDKRILTAGVGTEYCFDI